MKTSHFHYLNDTIFFIDKLSEEEQFLKSVCSQ